MPTPFHRLKMQEIRWLAAHYCAHGHPYVEHYQCYLREDPERERTGYFDIETSNLDADFGIMLAYCIKDGASKTIHNDVITLDDINSCRAGDEDKRVVQSCINDLAKFDKIVTFYGTRFDLPFTRTRALVCGVPFPFYGSIVHKDVYYLVRNKFKLSSNRLENSCRVLLDKTQKTRIEKRAWRAAARGDAKSLAYVLDHCKKDVLDLQKLYEKVIDFSARRDTSI